MPRKIVLPFEPAPALSAGASFPSSSPTSSLAPSSGAREVLEQRFAVPAGLAMIDPTIFRVGSFARSWRGCDVFVSTDMLPAEVNARQVTIHARIFAVSGGSRVQVGSGFLARNLMSGGGARWVCGVRAVAERFEVELFLFVGIGGAIDRSVLVTVVGHDEATEVPRVLGDALVAVGDVVSVPGARVAALRLVNTGAAMRYAQIWDDTAPGVALRVASYPLPAGSALHVETEDLDGRFFERAITVLGSTARTAWVNSVDVQGDVVIR